MNKKIKIIAKFLGFLFILFIVILTTLILRPSSLIQREKAIEQIAQKDSKFMNWNGTKIHYVDQGTGSIIIMIHGLGGSHRNFEKIAKELSKEYRIIRIDLPGFGLSEFPKNRTDLLNIYDEVLDTLMSQLNLDSIVLMGNSMGGMVSWVYTYKHPDKVANLILIGSAGYNLDAARKQAIQFAQFDFIKPLTKKGVPLFITKKGVHRCYYDSKFINPEEVKKANLFWNIEGNLDVFFKITQTKDFPNEAWIKQIKQPTLIIWGENDQIAPLLNASKFKNDLVHSNKIIYSHCGHMPQNECTDRLAKDIRIFLSKK